MSSTVNDEVAAVQKQFDSWAENYDTDSVEKMEYKLPGFMYETLKPLLDDEFHILDVGIGTGQLSALFKKHGRHITGVDISEQMLDVCQRNGNADEVYPADLNKNSLPFKDNQFDITASCGLTEYIESLSKLVNDMVRVTKSGGVIAVSYEISKDGQDVVNKNVGGFNVYSYSHQHVDKVLTEAGVSRISLDTVDGYINIFEGYTGEKSDLLITHGIFIGRVT